MRHHEGLGKKQEKPKNWKWNRVFNRVELESSLADIFLDRKQGETVLTNVPKNFWLIVPDDFKERGLEVDVVVNNLRYRGRVWPIGDREGLRLEHIESYRRPQSTPTQREQEYFSRLKGMRYLNEKDREDEILAARELEAAGFVDEATVQDEFGSLYKINWSEAPRSYMAGYGDIPVILFTFLEGPPEGAESRYDGRMLPTDVLHDYESGELTVFRG